MSLLADPTGVVGTSSTVVDATMTAVSVGSGDLHVFATPMMIALMEAAACDALDGHVAPDHTSVGTHVDVRHLAPSPIGAQVTAHATVRETQGARVMFDVTAVHVHGDTTVEIGRGTHTRVVVARSTFPASSLQAGR